MLYQGSKRFSIVKIGLLRAALPHGMETLPRNVHPAFPVVVERNVHKLGTITATNFTPTAVVTAGASRRAKYLAAGVAKTWVFMECGLPIQVDDEIGCGELMDRLRAELTLKICGRGTAQLLPGQEWPVITEVYPFENHLLYGYGGQVYRQHFALDPAQRIVHLVNGPVAVMDRLLEAGVAETMPRVQTGLHYAYAPARASDQTSSQGARNSELVTGILRSWKNINEAAALYVAAVRSGLRKPMRAAFCPVALTEDGKIADAITAHGITDVYDFAAWSAAQMEVKSGGVRVAAKRAGR